MQWQQRAANAADIEALLALILEHGPNPWNHLPPSEVTAHLQGMADGSSHALLAEDEHGLLGFVSHARTLRFRQQQPASRADAEQAYICEAVTHRDAAGQGIGSALLRQVVADIQAAGIADIYIDRHEQNAASAGMMRKAGFVEIATFADPERRPNGSRRTTLCRWQAP
ncbi:GNAT family N-acetyltransferase [Pseudomonas sp. PDM11]|uniref:GNAT family N-acetyltransferase n=1 Tax=Pseudomonas sp. PDM11 TaxID=2769309 RepID=UPI0017846D91|nr:GNAT family N-acetyltransferase [Pseudomonas sp. PDM11]MBD9395993.1 GNAT family N-acetyltransferase [Pseudomonas sp. PDM11]